MRRLVVRLTQAQLAQRAGVSRQLVVAVEAGDNTPAVDAAIRLAQALGSTVEDLFAPGSDSLEPALDEPLADGVPLRVGRVGKRLVAAALPDHGTAAGKWAAADGVLEHGRLRLFPGARVDGLLVGGCDPALGIAEAMLGGLSSASLTALAAPTDTALRALSDQRLHAAVVHGPADALPQPARRVIRIHLAAWQVGLAIGTEHEVRTLEAVLERGVPLVQREPAAASQQALQRAVTALGRVLTPGVRATGHIDAARMAAAGGCAAVTTEAAARAFGLRFIALEGHTVQIWVAEAWGKHPAVEPLGNLLNSRAFTDRLNAVGGYDLAGCGTVVSSV